MWQPHQDGILHMLQQLPAVPPHSLNNYKILPPIERRRGRRRSEVAAGGDPDLKDAVVQQQGETCCGSEEDESLRTWPNTRDPEPLRSSGARAVLLLAIRAPCGRRFQQHFAPTDTLQSVKSSAETKYGERYGPVSIRTMDVPRRSFTDMSLTLDQSAIVNRSLLCLTLSHDET